MPPTVRPGGKSSTPSNGSPSPCAWSSSVKARARRVSSVVQEMSTKGIPLVEFALSFKSRDSLITKLLAKKDTVAAQVYDKIRFRIVTRSEEDVVPMVNFLQHHLFPFNFVIPGRDTPLRVNGRARVTARPDRSACCPSDSTSAGGT